MSSSLESQKKALSRLIEKYSPELSEAIVIRGKKLQLSDSDLVSNAMSMVESLNELRLPIPKSTFNIARYGPALEDILADIPSFLTEVTVKKLSRRRGKVGVSYEVLDARRINNHFKNAKKPRGKTQDDEKIYNNFVNEAQPFLKEEKYTQAAKIFETGTERFVFKTSHSSMLLDLTLSCNNVQEKLNVRKQLEEKIRAEKEERGKLKAKIKELEEYIEKLELDTKETEEGKEVARLEEQLNDLLANQSLKKYLKLFRDAIHNYARALEQTDCTSVFSISLLDSIAGDSLNPNLDFQSTDLIEELCNQPVRLFNSRKWFRGRAPSLTDLKRQLQGPALDLWTKARDARKELDTAILAHSKTQIQKEILEQKKELEKLTDILSKLLIEKKRLDLEETGISQEIKDSLDKVSEIIN